MRHTDVGTGKTPTSCALREPNASDMKQMQALSRELKQLPPEAPRNKISTLIAKYQPKLSPTALAWAMAHAEKEKFETIAAALQDHPVFAKSYLKFNTAVSQYHKGADGIFCGIDCREKLLKPVESAKEELFSTMKKTSVKPGLQRELKQGIYGILSKTYEENSRRALVSARRASIGMNVSKAVRGEILSAGWFAIAMVTMGRTLGLATFEVAAAASSMEKILTETALTTLSRTAAGAASGAAVMGGARVAKMVGHAITDKTPEMSFFCRLAEELRAQGPQVIQDVLVGAAVGGTLGAIASGFRTSAPAFTGNATKAVLTPEVRMHMESRARMLGKKERILPSIGAAIAAHAAAATAVVAVSKNKPKPKQKEIIMVDLQNPPDALPTVAKNIPSPAKHEKRTKFIPRKVRSDKIATKGTIHRTPATDKPTGPSATTDPLPPNTDVSTSVSAVTTTESQPDSGLFRPKGIGSRGGSGTGTGINLFPSSRKLGEIEDTYRKRYQAKVDQGHASFYTPDDILLGSFQRHVIDELYSIWKYPPEALRAGITGVTPVEITFGRNGETKDVQLLGSSGDKSLDSEAVRAIRALGPRGTLPRSYPKDEYRLILLFEYGTTDAGAFRGLLR
ncbi:MAG: hypothetical protein A2X94_00930 [Bdellovibrionales bacterium GWB1_55_8]|nr:MAG: hypothetical protein A2X94_00930 [Bdellovibrionales bacterium GWB1_55_8]